MSLGSDSMKFWVQMSSIARDVDTFRHTGAFTPNLLSSK
jgi:hypothetical protein